MSEDQYEESSAGWDAIDAALEAVYGSQEPKHYGTVIPYSLGGPDPLNGISVYEVQTPLPHWHFVTYGFTELYEKEFEDPDYSGYGFELTLRLLKAADEEEPPAWALNLLQNLGRYVFGSGNLFRSGDYMDANGPIRLESDTKLTALSFIEDPLLPPMDTPNGRVEFIQLVGITHDELEAMQLWNTLGLLRTLEEHLPLYITDLDRDSLLQLPAVAAAVETGMEREGSNTGFLYVDQLAWDTDTEAKGASGAPAGELRLGAKQAEIVGKLLRGRLLKGKTLALASRDIHVTLQPGEQASVTESEDGIVLTLDNGAAAALSSRLRPVAESFTLAELPGAAIRILPTYIKDTEGNVVKTIG
ncbi:suppressor of fused domain protein [Paenibacillus sp. CN-4]|uniref:suppressor of fused domain protein n=1 Tax=Paenibacillus nanchangensis TaxID=3348343 RepID=UPI00397C2B46